MQSQAPRPHDEVADLLDRPLIAHLSTLGKAGEPHTQPVWYAWDGSTVQVSITTQRQKYLNVSRDPRVALSIQDPDRPLHYIEVRGKVTSIDPDPTGERTLAIGRKYGSTRTEQPDRDVRIILVITPTRFGTHPMLTRQPS